MNQQNSPQEVDVLQFFKAIGNFFASIKHSIKSLFVWLFDFFIKTLIYLKKHALYLGIGVLIGIIYAFVFQRNFKPVYHANIQLKANYESGNALENKINSFNGLIKNQEYDKLAKELGLTKDEASKLMGFKLTTDINDVKLVKEYEKYLMKLDTVVYKNIEYKTYSKNISKTPQLFPYKTLDVYASDVGLFAKLNNKFEHILDNDPVLIKKKKDVDNLLSIKKQKMIHSLVELDSLRQVFNKVYLENATKSNSGSTNIVVSNNKLSGAEAPVNIYYNRIIALKELEKIENQIMDNGSILSLENRFPEFGQKESILKYNPFIKYPILGFLLVLFILLLLDFNKFINKYQKEKLAE